MRRHGQSGLWFLAVGLGLTVGYTLLIWYGVFENDTAHQICGPGAPHRDNFFPPYTACGSVGDGYRVTSALAEYAGAALFVMAVAVLIAGAGLTIAERHSRRQEPARR